MNDKNILTALFCLTLLGACTPPQPLPSAISFYDSCARQASSFIDMAACGKETRNNSCEAHGTCSSNGNSIVMYVDSLATSVKTHEMTEAQAQRKWVEFRMALINAHDQQILQKAALVANTSPSTCYMAGDAMHCY